MMKSRSLLTVLLAVLSLCSAHRAAADDPAREQPRPILRTYVPRDEFAALLTKRDKPGRLVTVKEIKALLDGDFARRVTAAADAKGVQDKETARFPRDLVVDEAKVGVAVAPDRSYARLDVTLELTLHNVKEASFTIPAKGLLFEDVVLDKDDALLSPEGEAHRITVSGDGAHKLRYHAIVPVTTEGYSQVITAPLPAFPGGVAHVTIPGDGLEVRIEPGVDLTKKVDRDVTQVDAGLAGGSSIKVSWYTIARHAAVAAPAPGASAGEVAPRPAARTLTPVVFAEVCHVAGITDTKLEGVVDFRFTVHRAPVSSLTVKLPEGLGPVNVVSTPDVVAEKLVTANEVKVILTTPSEGEVGFALRYKKELELKPGARKADTVLPEFVPVDVAAQAGYVIVNRLANVRLEPEAGPALELLTNTPLPDKFRGYRSLDSLFIYKYLALPAPLKINIVRYENEDVLTAVVENLAATTVFARGGGQMTVVDYFIRNEHTEFLKLELPAGTEMERVLVDGKRVSASRHDKNAVRIPIKSKASSGPAVVRVQVAFRNSPDSAPATGCRAALPRIDLPALHVDWRWLVAEDTVLVNFSAGVRSLRARPHVTNANNGATYNEQVANTAGLKAYYIDEGLVAKGQSLEVAAHALKSRERLFPMFIFFLFGGLSVALGLRMLFWGKSTRSALLVLAVSYLSFAVVGDERELTSPFTGGINVAAWIAFLGLLLTGVREGARIVLARFGITLAVTLALWPSLSLAGGDWLPISRASFSKKAAEVDANQVKEEEEKRGLENLQNVLNKRSGSLRQRGYADKNVQQSYQQNAMPELRDAKEMAPSADGPSDAGVTGNISNIVPQLNAPTSPTSQAIPMAPSVRSAEPLPFPAPPPPPAEPAALAPLRIVLPYDDAAAPAATADALALVDADELEGLEAPKPTPSPSPVAPFGALLRDGKLKATVEGKRALVTATYRVRVARKGYVTVALPLGGAALDRATVDGEPLLLSAAQEAVLENKSGQPADRKIELQLTVPVTERDGGGELSLTLPNAPVLALALTVPQKNVVFDLSSGQGVSQKESDQDSVIEAVLPPGQVRVKWSPRRSDEIEEPHARAERIEDAAPVEGAQAQVNGIFHTEYVYENGVLTARTRAQYEIFAPGRDALSMILPRDMEVLSVTDGQGKPVVDQVHNPKDGKLTIYLPAKLKGEQTFEVLQKSVVAETRAEAGKSSSTKVKFWPAGLVDVTRAVGSAAFRVPGENMRLEWPQRREFIAANKVDTRLRSFFPTAPQFVWQAPDPSGSEFVEGEVVVTRLARSVTRSFKVESARAWTMVTDGGDTLTRCLYSVRNTGEQFFSLRLPDGAKLESAFVHTKPVTPGKGAAAQEYYIPLVMSREAPNQPGGEPFDVEVVYTAKLAAPLGQMGNADLALARPVDELDQVDWSVFLPDGYRLSPVEGKFRLAGRAQAPSEGLFDNFARSEGSSYDEEALIGGKQEAAAERSDRSENKAAIYKRKAPKQAPIVVPAETTNAGLLPIRVTFPQVSNGTAFQRTGMRSNDDLTLAFSYCRNQLIDLVRALLEALAFLCCTGFVLAIAQRRPIAGTLVGALVAMVALGALSTLFPAPRNEYFAQFATIGLLMLYALCKPIRWATARNAAALVLFVVATAQAQVPGTPTVLVPYDEKAGAATVLSNLSVHALMPSEVAEKVKKKDEKPEKPDDAKPQPPVPYVVMRGDIDAKVKGAVATLDVTYQVRVLAEGWQRIPLITGDLTVGAAQLGSEPGAVVVEENDAYVQQEVAQNQEIMSTLGKSDASIKNLARDITTLLLVKGKGDYTVKFQGECSVAVDAAGAHRLSLSPPVFPQGTLTATFPSCDLNVDGQGIARVDPEEDRAANRTTIKAPMTPARPVVLSWTERASARAHEREEEPAPEAAPSAAPSVAASIAPPVAPPAPVAELKPVVIARSVSKLTVDDTSLRGDIVYTLNIHRSSQSALTFTFPAGVNIYEVSGPEIQSPHRERTVKDGKHVIVDFKQRFSGETQFIIRYNRPLKGERKNEPRVELKVPVVRCRDAAFESGTIGVERDGGVEVTEASHNGLERIELPRLDADTLRLLPGQILMAYTFASKDVPCELVLSVLRHQEVKELQTAVIRTMWATSAISEQRMTTKMRCEVRNSGCPFLEVELPEKATLRRVVVNNRPVSASSDNDPRRQLIALEAPPAGEANHIDQSVELEYSEPLAPLGRAGNLTARLAQVNLPVIGHGLDWTLTLPQGFVFKDVVSGVRPNVARDYLNPFNAMPMSLGSRLSVHRSAVNFHEAVTVEFDYGPPWSLALRLLIAGLLGFLMAAWITSGVTWITEGGDGLARLVLAAIAGAFAIAWETRNPGTGFGFYAGGFIGVVTPVGFRILRVARRWWSGAAATALVLLALSGAPVRAQDSDTDGALVVESAAESSAKPKAGAGWLEMGSEVLVPQDRLAKRMGTKGEWSVLSRQSIEAMLSKLIAPDAPKPEEAKVQPPLAYVILSGTLTGQVSSGDGQPSASFDGAYKVQVYQKGVVQLGIDPHDAAVRAVTLDGKPAAMLMGGSTVQNASNGPAPVELAVPDSVQIYVAEPGLHTIGIKFAARVDVLKEVHNLQLAVPACPATDLDLEIPAREPAISVVPSTQVNVKAEAGVNRVRTRLKYTQTVFVRWRDRLSPVPRPTAAAPEEATVFEVVDDLSYKLLPGMVETTAKLAVSVRSGAVSSLSITVPPAASVIGAEGPGIERWRNLPSGKGIEVPFHSKMRGNFTVTVRCVSPVEAPQKTEDGVLTQSELPSLAVQQALSQSGVLRLFLPSGEDVRENLDRTLTKIDPSEAPSTDGGAVGDRVYRSVRAGWKMSLVQVRREDLSTSSTRVPEGNVSLLVPRQGLWIARATYQVENETEQFLKVMLPRASLLLSCVVDGQPRRPSKEDENFLIPLAKSELQGSALRRFPVVLVYVMVGSTTPELGTRGPLDVALPRLEYAVDRTTLSIGTPRDIFLYGEDPAFMSRETSITGVFERMLTMRQLHNPLEIFFAIFSVSSRRMSSPMDSFASTSRSSREMAYPAAAPTGMMKDQRRGNYPRAMRAMKPGQFAPQKARGRSLDIVSSLSEASGGGAAADGASDPEAPAKAAEDNARDQQVAGFLEIMKRSSGSTGALPVDIDFELNDMRITNYTLLLAPSKQSPSVSLSYVSMRWGGAIGGVLFFLLPVCLIALMLSPGATRVTRVLPLVGLGLVGLIVAALAEWGLDLIGWFILGIPAGVVAAPLLKLNRSLSNASEEE